MFAFENTLAEERAIYYELSTNASALNDFDDFRC